MAREAAGPSGMRETTMSRDQAIACARQFFDDGGFIAGLRDLVAVRSESQISESRDQLDRYMELIADKLGGIGFSCRTFENPLPAHAGFLLAERREGDELPTVLIYGHGDVVPGMEGKWADGVTPWDVTVVGDKWFGRGTADNKGQHWTVVSALKCLLETQGRLGFNVKILLEMGEEVGSPGLHALCRQEKQVLKADVLLACDGPRLRADRPTLFMGSRGSVKFALRAQLRKRNYHSGNWGGILKDPVVRLSHALAAITDAKGRLLVDAWRPQSPSATIKAALADCAVADDDGGGVIDPDWGEPGLSLAERLYAWNSLSVIAIGAGDVGNPVNAIPGEAVAVCQLRFIVGLDPQAALDALRAHLDAQGFTDIVIEWDRASDVVATRLDLAHPWVEFVAESIRRTTGHKPQLLPNLGGALPNDCFSDILDLPTIWIPHSYPACAQHAPNEHALGTILSEGLRIMTGVFWDIGDRQAPAMERFAR